MGTPNTAFYLMIFGLLGPFAGFGMVYLSLRSQGVISNALLYLGMAVGLCGLAVGIMLFGGRR